MYYLTLSTVTVVRTKTLETRRKPIKKWIFKFGKPVGRKKIIDVTTSLTRRNDQTAGFQNWLF